MVGRCSAAPPCRTVRREVRDPGRGSAGVGSEGWAGLVWRGMGIVDIAYIPSNNVDFLRALVYCATRSYPAHTKTYFSTVV